MVDLKTRHANEAQFYDEVYSKPMEDADLIVTPEHTPGFHCGMEVIGEELLTHIGPLRNKRILEVGCGGGVFSTYFALHGAQVTGIDVSESALAIARRRAAISLPSGGDQPRFLRVPVESMDSEFPRGSFDVVFGFAVAHHFEQSLFPSKVDWVLDDGGTLALYEPTPHSALIQRLRQSRLVQRLAPVGKDTDFEEPFYRTTVLGLSRVLVLREYPCRTLLMALAEIAVTRSPRATKLINVLLSRFPVDERWPYNGCGAKHRLNRLDRYLVRRIPWLGKLGRTSIIVGRKPRTAS